MAAFIAKPTQPIAATIQSLGSSTGLHGLLILGAGAGSLAIAASQALTTSGSDLVVTAFDLSLPGLLTAGNASVTVHGSQATQTIGLVSSIQQTHASIAELEIISSRAGLALGSPHRHNVP